MNEPGDGVLADPSYVADQYEDSSKLNARQRLYARNEPSGTPSFFRWLLGAIEFPPAARVLEVGCGDGGLWRENSERIPPDARILLSDSSPAMIDAAGRRLAGVGLAFERFDVQEIPHADAAFDVVIAGHMLYHVPDRPKALREIRRVLRNGGKLYATTNAWTHLIELRALVERFVPEAHVLPGRYLPGVFDAENGARELQQVFGSVQVRYRRSKLEITDAADVVDYVRTLVPGDALFRDQALREHVEWVIGVAGHFHVTVAAALLVADR